MLAISTDDLTQAGYAAEQFGTPFPILSNVSRAYGVPNHFGDGLATGSIFVIDPHGNVRWSKIYTHIKDHVPTVEIADQLTAEGRTPCGVRPSPRPNLIAGTTTPLEPL